MQDNGAHPAKETARREQAEENETLFEKEMDMSTFEVKDTFYLNGKPFQIISGSIHYFRIVPEYWRDRLEKLKGLGMNTVETYIPWNMHEPEKGRFVLTACAMWQSL